jgi:site-specific DNA recombinase
MYIDDSKGQTMARTLSKANRTAKQADLGLERTCTALYIRVSTQLQADEGFSLEAQQERLRAHCTAQGWTVCPNHIYVDAGVSGKSVDRPQFQAMLQAAKEGKVQRIVAMKLDRMARNVREFLATVDQLKAWHCDLVLVKESFDTSTPHGRFALTMFAAMAELEASTITERVMTGKAQKAQQGGYNGSRCPLGYSYSNGQFQVNEQAATVRNVFDMFLAGKSINAIAKDLNDNSVPTAMGGKWYASTVSVILDNGAYAGAAQWNGCEVDNAFPAIITKETYEQAHRRLQALRPGKQLESEVQRRLQIA